MFGLTGTGPLATTAIGTQIPLVPNKGGGTDIDFVGDSIILNTDGPYMVHVDVTGKAGSTAGWEILTCRTILASSGANADISVVGFIDATQFDELSLTKIIQGKAGDLIQIWVQGQVAGMSVDGRSNVSITKIAAKGAPGPQGPSGVSGVIPVFADMAARDAAFPSPANGQTCVLLSPAPGAGLQVYRTVAPVGWWPPWNTPWGEFGFASLAADMTMTTNNETSVVDLGIQTYLAGRKYVIEAEVLLTSTLATTRALARIYNYTDGIRRVIHDGVFDSVNLAPYHRSGWWLKPTTNVSKGFRLTYQNASATGTLTIHGGDDGAWIRATDIGPQ
jgi:hypothetical protein